MSAITTAVVGRLKADTGAGSITALLATYRSEPAVFSTLPVPADSPRPYIYCGEIISDVPADTKTTQRREHSRDVECFTDASLGSVVLVEQIAERVRTLFNRHKLVVNGYHTMIGQATGPSTLPTDAKIYGRLVQVRLTLEQQP